MRSSFNLHRRDFLRGALATGAVVSGGCSRFRSDDEVTFLALGSEGREIGVLVEEFERAHPKIKIKLQKLPWTAAHQKLLTAFAGDSLPDVFQLGNTWIPEFASLNALEPLDTFAASSNVVDQADYFPGVWDNNVIDARLYGVQWYVDTRLLFYRKDLLAQAGYSAPPTTWSEWAAMLAAIKRDVGANRYAVLLPLNEFEPLLNLGIQQPDAFLRNGNTYGNFRSAGFQRTLTFYRDTFANGWAPLVTNTQVSNVWDEFAHGMFSFYLSGPWNIVEFQKRMPASLNAWMTAPLPGPDGPGASIAGGSSLVISRHARHKDAAWKLIEFLSTPDAQIKFHTLTGAMPPRRTSWSRPELAQDDYARAFHVQLERAKPTPKIPEWERIADEIHIASEQVVQTRVSVGAACAELDRRVDEILEKRRWVLGKRAQL